MKTMFPASVPAVPAAMTWLSGKSPSMYLTVTRLQSTASPTTAGLSMVVKYRDRTSSLYSPRQLNP